MTLEQKLAEYARERLGARELPTDLRALLTLQWQRAAGKPSADTLEELGVTLLEVGESDPGGSPARQPGVR